jgi:hypothetical protein
MRLPTEAVFADQPQRGGIVAEQQNTPPNSKPAENQTEGDKEREIREAVERVYRKYGTDFSAFGRDVQKELEKRGA